MSILILKKRFGFATNSSSSHSVVYAPGHQFQDDDLSGGDGPGTGGFGWGPWAAVSSEAKRLYWATQLRDNLKHLIPGRVPHDYYDMLATTISGVELPPGYGIDHQSIVMLPRQHGKSVLDAAFYHQFVTALDHDDILIVGGNDNVSQHHEALDQGTRVDIGIPVDVYLDPPAEAAVRYPTPKRRCLVARYDQEFDQWVLFNQYTGEKTRLSFRKFELELEQQDSYPSSRVYGKGDQSGFPELVDVKLTDYCDRGCVWCYQGSGKRGKHAEIQKVNKLARMFRDLGVLEVALGGGEPTSHPQFCHVLEIFRDNDIVPNFSTGTLTWLDDPKTVGAVRRTVGGFAYTARNAAEVEELISKITTINSKMENHRVAFRFKPDNCGGFSQDPDCPIVTIHIVMGTLTRQEFKEILEKCAAYELGVVLLAYKQRGRGKGKKPIPYDWWTDEVRDMRTKGCYGTVSIDTPLAQQSQKELKRDGISPLYFDVVEGTRSMYVDLVKDKIAPHSYVPESGFQSLRYADGPDLDKLYSKLRAGEPEDPAYIKVMNAIHDREQHYHQQGVKFLLQRFRHYRDAAMAAKKEK